MNRKQSSKKAENDKAEEIARMARESEYKDLADLIAAILNNPRTPAVLP